MSDGGSLAVHGGAVIKIAIDPMQAGIAHATPEAGLTPCAPANHAAAETQNRQARRTRLVGQLAGGIVHDFNNIFTALIGTLGILAEAVADQPELAVAARLADEAAARGIGLASDLLIFAGGQPSQFRDVAIDALMADAVRLLRPVLGGRIEIDSPPAAAAVHAVTDGNQLMAAIFYLSLNARDAMPDGGKLLFTTAREALTEHPACANKESIIPGQVVITIRPINTGIPPAGIAAHGAAGIFADLDAAQDCMAPAGGRVEICDDVRGGISIRICLPG